MGDGPLKQLPGRQGCRQAGCASTLDDGLMRHCVPPCSPLPPEGGLAWSDGLECQHEHRSNGPKASAGTGSAPAPWHGPYPSHLAPGRADYEQAFNGLNLITEKISGTLFEISGTLAKTLATLKSSGTPLGVSLKAQELFLKSVDPIL